MASLLTDDHYALLGVHAGADGEELSRAWRQLVSRWHPERAGESATATFQKLSTAYAVLSDPIARAAYDRGRRAAEPESVSPPPQPARPPTPSAMLSRLSRPLTTLIAVGAAQLDEPCFITLLLRDDEAAQGGMVSVSLHVDLWCPDCTGQEPSAECERCGGKRMVRELFTAWLAVPPGVTQGEVLAPSVELPSMVAPVRFRVRLRGPT